jgi:hypothetical protein
MEAIDRAEYESLATGAEYALQRLTDDDDFQSSPAVRLRPSVRAKALMTAMDAIKNKYRGLHDYITQAATVALARHSIGQVLLVGGLGWAASERPRWSRSVVGILGGLRGVLTPAR